MHIYNNLVKSHCKNNWALFALKFPEKPLIIRENVVSKPSLYGNLDKKKLPKW